MRLPTPGSSGGLAACAAAEDNCPPCLEGLGPPPTPLHGPAFRQITAREKNDLIRLHNNLGHPAPETLARHLTAAKATTHIVQAAREFVCDACVESTQPRHQHPAKLHEPQEFNDTVRLDSFYWRGQAGFQVGPQNTTGMARNG